jgi:hypothetical protein
MPDDETTKSGPERLFKSVFTCNFALEETASANPKALVDHMHDSSVAVQGLIFTPLSGPGTQS